MNQTMQQPTLDTSTTHQSRRFALLAERDINQETFVEPWPEAGLVVTDSPYDPQPSLKLDSTGDMPQVLEMDGKPVDAFDAIDIGEAFKGQKKAFVSRPSGLRPSLLAGCLRGVSLIDCV